MPTSHFSNASGKMVWLVYENVAVVIYTQHTKQCEPRAIVTPFPRVRPAPSMLRPT